MARRQKLKVFRTPAGFHDAYVAAPSRKAALEAWGSDADLFARGIAEEVSDEVLIREPLENPGRVIRRSRGTAAEQLAALPADALAPRKLRRGADEDGEPVIRRKASTRRSGKSRGSKPKAKVSNDGEPKPKAAAEPKPRPSRARLDEVESALAGIVERQKREAANQRDRERALEKERRTMEAAHARERRTAERAVEREREAHAERLDRWIEENG